MKQLKSLIIIMFIILCFGLIIKAERNKNAFKNATMVANCLAHATEGKAIDYPCLSGVNQMWIDYKKIIK